LKAGQISGDLPWVSPLTTTEAFLAAGILWALGWILAGLRKRKRIVVPILLAALITLGYGEYVSRVYARTIALVTQDDAPLRAAPFGPAPVVRELLSGSTVTVRNNRPGWVLVERRGDLGWLKLGEIAPL
ncbi:MAG: SH3 domain-containing protein, partial [Gemmatimonadales bacterium]